MKNILIALLYFFALCVMADFSGWQGEAKYPSARFKLEKNLLKAVPENKKHISVLQLKSVPAYNGMKIAFEAEFSGKGDAVFGTHLYVGANKWAGLCKSKNIVVNSEDFKKINGEIVIKNDMVQNLRPFIRVFSGNISIRNLKWKVISAVSDENRTKTPIFNGWFYASQTTAAAIKMNGTGDSAISVLSIHTLPTQKTEFISQKLFKVNENDLFKFRFTLSGKGNVVFGLHLYDKSYKWQGKLTAEKIPAGFGDANFTVKTPAGKNPVVNVRPFVVVMPKSNVDIGNLSVNFRTMTFKKPEVDLPLADGFELINQQKGDFPIRFFASENKIVLDQIETPYDKNADKVIAAVFRAVSTDGRKIGEGRFNFENGFIRNKSFPINADFTGEFKVNADYLDKNGKKLSSGSAFSAVPHMDLYSGRYMTGGFILSNAHLKEWVKNYPMGQRVFKRKHYPFEKMLKAEHGFPNFAPPEIRDNKIILNNRVYTIGKDGFVSQANSHQIEPTVGNADEDLLSSPIALLLNGRKLDWTCSELKKEKNSVLWSQKASFDGGKFTVNNQLDPDGALKMVISFEPDKNFNGNNVALQIPVRKSQSTLYQNITDVTYRRLDRSKKLGQTPLGGFAGFTPDKKIRGNTVWESKGQERTSAGSFQPFIWLGNEDRGFCYFADSDRDWIVDDSRSAHELARDEKSVILKINFINTNQKITARKMQWTIGLMATPVKNPMAKWRGTIFPRWMTMDKKFYSKLDNVRKIIMVSAGHPVFNSGTQSITAQDIDRTRKAYKDIKDKFNSTYLEYFCSDELNINNPEMETYFSEWAAAPAGSKTYSKSKRIKSKSYDYKGATSLYMQRISPSYLKYRSWAIGDKLSKVGLFAFYEDNVHTRGYHDPYRELGDRDAKGNLHYEFDLFSLRDYFHSLAGEYKKNNMENLTGAHGSASLLIPALANCTFFIDGEQPGRYDNKKDMDYIDHWRDLDYIRAVSMGRAFGINTIFLSEMIFPGDDADGKHSRAWLALMVPHDMAPWDGATKNRAPVRAWHKMVNDLNFYSDHPRLYPYWAKGKYKVFEHDHKDLLVTVFKQSKQTVIFLSNFGEANTFNVKILTDRLGCKNFKVLTDVETQKHIPVKNNSFSVQIPRHDFKVILAR